MAFDLFENRHIGPRCSEYSEMLDKVGASSLEELINRTIPESIRLSEPLKLNEDAISEYESDTKFFMSNWKKRFTPQAGSSRRRKRKSCLPFT